MKLFQYTLENRAELILKSYKNIISKHDKVLDVGCGNGVISKIVSNKFGCKITGTDIIDYRKTEIKFKKMKGNGKLPFKKNSFDTVIFNDMLHHTSRRQQGIFLKEALRVGKKVLIFELKPTLYAKFTDWLANKSHNWSMPTPMTQRTMEEWEFMFQENKIHFLSIEIKRSFPEKPFSISYENLAELLYYPITNYFFLLTRTK